MGNCLVSLLVESIFAHFTVCWKNWILRRHFATLPTSYACTYHYFDTDPNMLQTWTSAAWVRVTWTRCVRTPTVPLFAGVARDSLVTEKLVKVQESEINFKRSVHASPRTLTVFALGTHLTLGWPIQAIWPTAPPPPPGRSSVCFFLLLGWALTGGWALIKFSPFPAAHFQ